MFHLYPIQIKTQNKRIIKSITLSIKTCPNKYVIGTLETLFSIVHLANSPDLGITALNIYPAAQEFIKSMYFTLYPIGLIKIFHRIPLKTSLKYPIDIDKIITIQFEGDFKTS